MLADDVIEAGERRRVGACIFFNLGKPLAGSPRIALILGEHVAVELAGQSKEVSVIRLSASA